MEAAAIQAEGKGDWRADHIGVHFVWLAVISDKYSYCAMLSIIMSGSLFGLGCSRDRAYYNIEFSSWQMYRTPKCSHGDKGMCIHCLVNKTKQNSGQLEATSATPATRRKCTHPAHMKCLQCLPTAHTSSTTVLTLESCKHADY